ncbi:transposase, MuDR, MULE transposase domain protein [Tanacetum coccineum]
MILCNVQCMVERCLRIVGRKVVMGMVFDSKVVMGMVFDSKVVMDIDNLLKKGKLEQVVAIVKSCSPNALGDLNVTLKDLLGTIPGTINYKVLDVGGYGKDITVGAAMILANVSVFTPKPS